MSGRPTERSSVRHFLVLAILAASLLGSGCLSRTRKVAPPPPAPKTASLEELLAKIDRFTRVESLKARVDLQLSYLNDARTTERELTDVRGFILAQRPSSIRVMAQIPVTRQRAFDMASDGETFRVHLAWRNRFIEGDAAETVRSEKRAENIRPQHVLEPLIVAARSDDEIAVLDSVVEGRVPYYVVQMLRRGAGGVYRIARKFWFNRIDLNLQILELRDDSGEIATRARYSGWFDAGEALFPMEVAIERPLDGYTLKVAFLEPGIGEPPPDDAFDLQPPPGVRVERVGEAETAEPSP